MKDVYTIIIEKDEDGYFVGSIPALPGCHTQAKSVDQLMERMEEAIALWLEVENVSDHSPLELVGIQRLAV
ncbi:MAG: type II toxin-antitoxin system HicB family antitoxin [Gammaproteobacteria bacterium]|nr:type II toxin-antitoxin system HicB family antitoxin [Gammaproteobacteria bacterium]